MLNRRVLNQIADPSEELRKALGHLRVAVAISMHGNPILQSQGRVIRKYANELERVYVGLKAYEVESAD